MKFLTPSAIALSCLVTASIATLSCSKPAESAERAGSPAGLSAVASAVDPSNPPHGQPGPVHDDPPGAGINAPPLQTTGNPAGQAGTKSNSWFQFTDLNMGTFYKFEKATGSFPFKNPTAETRKIANLRKTCQCTRSTWMVGDREYSVEDTADAQNVLFQITYEGDVRVPERVDFITVEPGEEGSVTVEMEMNGAPSKHASLGFTIDDPELPSMMLDFHALGTVYFSVVPEEVNLNTMRWDETREFEVQVTSPVMGDFEITRHDAPAGLKVSYDKTVIDGQALYTIKGTYGPDGPPNGGALKFYTDREGYTFDVRVLAMVQGPLTVSPKFLALGLVKAGTSGSKATTISAADDFDLQVTKLESKELSFAKEFLNATWKKNEAGEVVVTVEVLPGVPSGTVVRGELIVHLNHPAAESEPILFNGMVR